MNDIAIRVENLSKRYRIGVERHDTLRDALSSFLPRIPRLHPQDKEIREIRDHSWQKESEFWALRDVSFEIKRGEVVGVIGRNGAGKSTLLKILSRITEPTTGLAEIHGRVGSLLEVGTGFHPELTGRENIYLNGAILGMKRTEIDRKFDEIVAFSEIEKFLDTPVKRYSSGMYVRLAFAVAAHLEPEILLVDEVLAVGDAAFQKKCVGKMGDVAREGRTVLFVSHNLGIIVDLCTRAILLSGGRISRDSLPADIVAGYIAHDSMHHGYRDLRFWNEERSGTGDLRVTYVCTTDVGGKLKSKYSYGEPICIHVGTEGKSGTECVVGISIRNSSGQLVLHYSNLDDRAEVFLTGEKSEIVLVIPSNPLNDGEYSLTVWLGDAFNLLRDRVGNCLSFRVNSEALGRVVSLASVRMSGNWSVKNASGFEH
ncbi:MAG: Teichoic acids export ATP-binding protein TagH [Chloroflexi bacterium ADurb.Bin360]|nr:MAG: Teichoic acids export ATP-binding protein TagH [Chloroflexi bacterium ADurb.Bin360]